MLPGPQEFLDSIHGMAFRLGWPILPSKRRLRACRAHALELDDFSGNAAVEAAALFFACSFDERRAWPVHSVLPLAMALHHLLEHRLTLRTTDDLAGLGWLRHAIAEGSADWPAVRAWFLERTQPRP